MKKSKLKLQEEKMEKNTGSIVLLFAVLSLLVGLLIGAVMFPQVEIKEVEKIVTKNIEVEVEVPVEVEVEVEKDFEAYKQLAVELCFEEFLDDIDLDRYQDAEVRTMSDEWSIVFDTYRNDDRVTTTIEQINFRVFDSLEEEREDYRYSCQVIDREDKDLKVVLN